MVHIQELSNRLERRTHLAASVADSASGKMLYLPVQDLDLVFVHPVFAAVPGRRNLSAGCCKQNRQQLLWLVLRLSLLLCFLLIVQYFVIP